MNISRERILLILLIGLFISIRLFGVDLPYHQDERKYVARGLSLLGVGVTSGHPPLLGIIITMAGFLFGDKFFRLMPILFGTGSLVMFYFLIRTLINSRTALWAGLLYAISPYGVWASLMVDVDGAVLPFFALSTFLFYTLWHNNPDKRRLYGVLFLTSLILGALVKLSFALVFAALGADIVLRFWQNGYRKVVYIAGGLVMLSPLLMLGFIAFLALLLPTFNFKETLGHAQEYIRFSGRNYGQTLYQLFKAILYLSPLLVIPAFLVSIKNLLRLRVLLFYLFFSLIFYLILFDFSSAALDKYLMVLIIPLSALSGAALAEAEWTRRSWAWLGVGLITSAILLFVLTLPHAVPPLYPKGEWMGRILGLKWNFLVPFMGGSGPAGFYMSWLFMAMAWIAAAVAGIIGLICKNTQLTRIFILVVGVTYSVIMFSALLFGYPHGSSKEVLNDALRYIERAPKIQSVIVAHDIGGYYLQKMGKYERRMYAVPKYEKLYQELLDKHYGHLLVIDIPRIYQNSIYWKYISSCKPEFVSRSGYITATVYDCSKHAKL